VGRVSPEYKTEKFLASWAAKPETAAVVALPRQDGPARYAISRDLSPQEIEQITAPRASASVPQGINTRSPRRIESPDDLLSAAARGVMTSPLQDRGIAQSLAENAMRDPLADVEASRAIDAVQDVAIEDEIAEYEAMIAQIELSEEQAADIAGAAELQERAFAFVETARAAALCVART